MEESFPYEIDICNPIESDASASLGHRWVYCENDNLIVAAHDNELCTYPVYVVNDSDEPIVSLNIADSYSYSSPIKSITYSANRDSVCVLVDNRCELLYPADLNMGVYKSYITPFKEDASSCFCLQDAVLFCSSDKITRVSFTGQRSEQSFSHPILAIDTFNDAIALVLANGDTVFLSGSDLQETSRIAIPSIDTTSICTLLWGDASHLLLGVASSSLHLYLLSHRSTWSSKELEPLCTPDTDRPLSSPWSLCFDASFGLFVTSHAVSSELCLVSRVGRKWQLLSASDGENVCVPLNDCFEPLPVLRMAVVHTLSRCFLLFAAEGEDAAAGIWRVDGGGDDDDGDDSIDDGDDSIDDDVVVIDGDDSRNESIDDDSTNDNTSDDNNNTTPDETPIPIDNEYQTLLPPPLSLPAAIPAFRELRQQIQHHSDHYDELNDQLNSLPRETLLSASQRIQNAIRAETEVLEQLREAADSLRQFLEKSAESIRVRSQHPSSLRWDLLSRGFLGEERCAIVAPTATETNVVVQSLNSFFDEKPASLHVSFASMKERVASAVTQKWRSHSEQRVGEVYREDVFASLEREEREKEKEKEVAAAKEAARVKEEERKRKMEETLLKEKAEKEKKKREEKERKEKEEKEKEKKETPATGNPFAAAQSASGASGTKENGNAPLGKPSVSQPANGTSSSGGGLFNSAASSQGTSGGFGKKSEGNCGLFGKPGENNGGVFGKPAENSNGIFGKPGENSNGIFGKPTETTGLFGKPAENAGGAFNKPAANNGGLFTKPAESAGKGGLFGHATPEANGGLFGKPTESSSGLFNKPATDNGGLFGKPATDNGLFGKPATDNGLFGKPATQGGLFGSQGTQTFANQQTQGGLFGSANQQPAFGAPKGGLFASQTKQVNPDKFQRLITEFYQKYNATKLHEVPGIIAKYRGNELALCQRLEKKYCNGEPALSGQLYS